MNRKTQTSGPAAQTMTPNECNELLKEEICHDRTGVGIHPTAKTIYSNRGKGEIKSYSDEMTKAG